MALLVGVLAVTAAAEKELVAFVVYVVAGFFWIIRSHRKAGDEEHRNSSDELVKLHDGQLVVDLG